MSKELSAHRNAARWQKVAKLLSALYVSEIPVKAVPAFTDEQWCMVARIASVREPSQETKDLICGIIRYPTG